LLTSQPSRGLSAEPGLGATGEEEGKVAKVANFYWIITRYFPEVFVIRTVGRTVYRRIQASSHSTPAACFESSGLRSKGLGQHDNLGLTTYTSCVLLAGCGRNLLATAEAQDPVARLPSLLLRTLGPACTLSLEPSGREDWVNW
jgi:hypothetical protein